MKKLILVIYVLMTIIVAECAKSKRPKIKFCPMMSSMPPNYCPPKLPPKKCVGKNKNPCKDSKCSKRGARCVPNYCGSCHACWYTNPFVVAKDC